MVLQKPPTAAEELPQRQCFPRSCVLPATAVIIAGLGEGFWVMVGCAPAVIDGGVGHRLGNP